MSEREQELKPKPTAELTSCWPSDDHAPRAEKTIYDYQAQLRAKRKRKRRPQEGKP